MDISVTVWRFGLVRRWRTALGAEGFALTQDGARSAAKRAQLRRIALAGSRFDQRDSIFAGALPL